MSLGVWIGLGVVVWLVLGVGVALLVGRIVRQVPDDEPGDPDSGPVEQASPSGRGVPRQGGPPDGHT